MEVTDNTPETAISLHNKKAMPMFKTCLRRKRVYFLAAPLFQDTLYDIYGVTFQFEASIHVEDRLDA